MSDIIHIDAPAKINLYLEIKRRRADGYHELDSLMQKISLYDRLSLEKRASGITLSCPDSDLPEDESNLVYRAAQAFFAAFAEHIPADSRGVGITLRKSIPIAAGLGGGSSDAAAVLNGLNTLFATNRSSVELEKIGVGLGADVPFFVATAPAARATGIGEILTPAVALAGYYIVLVNPGFAVSTRWVYDNFMLTRKGDRDIIFQHDGAVESSGLTAEFNKRMIEINELRNDLESVTVRRHNEITLLKQRMLRSGASCALMSGSGPSVFGLFPETSKADADACVGLLSEEYEKTFLVHPLSD